MLSPNGPSVIEDCLNCHFRTEHTLCGLSPITRQSFERIKVGSIYPKGAVLFMQGQSPRGVFVLCNGQVKLSICAGDGKTFIVRVAQPAELLGLSATISGKPYELTAETIEPCQVNFVQREAFLRFLKDHSDASFKVAEQLSLKYSQACHELRSLGLSSSAGEKLAKLLLGWSQRDGQSDKATPRLRLLHTQDEIAQMIGCCRETVTRLFFDLKRRRIADCRGSTLLIRDKGTLEGLADNKVPQLRLTRGPVEHRSRVGSFRPN